MIICLNARNQENILSGSREKCITYGCIQGWLVPIYIKLQKQLYEIKIGAFFSFCRICTWTAQLEQRSKVNRQRKSRGIEEYEDVGKFYLKIFGDFPKTITWGILMSLEKIFRSILRTSEFPLSILPFLSSCHLFHKNCNVIIMILKKPCLVTHASWTYILNKPQH